MIPSTTTLARTTFAPQDIAEILRTVYGSSRWNLPYATEGSKSTTPRSSATVLRFSSNESHVVISGFESKPADCRSMSDSILAALVSNKLCKPTAHYITPVSPNTTGALLLHPDAFYPEVLREVRDATNYRDILNEACKACGKQIPVWAISEDLTSGVLLQAQADPIFTTPDLLFASRHSYLQRNRGQVFSKPNVYKTTTFLEALGIISSADDLSIQEGAGSGGFSMDDHDDWWMPVDLRLPYRNAGPLTKALGFIEAQKRSVFVQKVTSSFAPEIQETFKRIACEAREQSATYPGVAEVNKEDNDSINVQVQPVTPLRWSVALDASFRNSEELKAFNEGALRRGLCVEVLEDTPKGYAGAVRIPDCSSEAFKSLLFGKLEDEWPKEGTI